MAQDNSGWRTMGVWQVPPVASGPISITSVSPAGGGGSSGVPQSFTFTLTDTKGIADIGIVNVLVNNALDASQACYLAYLVQGNTLVLVDDTGNAGGPFAGTAILNGAGGPIQNSQCVVSGLSSAMTSGNSLSLMLNVVFKGSFVGNRIVYAAARDSLGGNNTDWQPVGTWIVQ